MQRRGELPEAAQALLKRHVPDALVVAKNIIRKYGKAEFQLLIQLFQEGAPTRKVMAAFQVTRQRVSQWRDALGTQTVVYEPDPKLADLLPRPEPRVTRRVSA